MTRLDLNLVRAFVAIYETKSVTKAAAALAVTQPALSHSLAKLRYAYGEPLFVRGRDGLTPTVLADQLFERLSKGDRLDRQYAGIEGPVRPGAIDATLPIGDVGSRCPVLRGSAAGGLKLLRPLPARCNRHWSFATAQALDISAADIL